MFFDPAAVLGSATAPARQSGRIGPVAAAPTKGGEVEAAAIAAVEALAGGLAGAEVGSAATPPHRLA
jgi:hypothetical protein